MSEPVDLEASPDQLRRAREQLDLVLGFFNRVDSRLSVIFAADIGMASLMAACSPSVDELRWSMAVALVPLALLSASVWKISQGFFPRLEGGAGSLLYFREVAKRSSSEFNREWTAELPADQLQDLLSQVWRNSQILTDKFDHLKQAFVFTAWAILPWLLTLEVLILERPPARSVIGR